MDKKLFEILVCPYCKGEVQYDPAALRVICRFDRLAFPIINGIPMMLEDRALRMNDEEP